MSCRVFIILILLCCNGAQQALAQDSSFSFRLDLFGGSRVPVYNSKNDNPFISRYGAVGGYIGVAKSLGRNWEAGIGIRYMSLPLDKQKTLRNIRRAYLQPGFLSDLEKNGNPEITNVELSLARHFRLKQLIISPFVNVGLVGWMWVNDFRFYQKKPNEHYYISTVYAEEEGHNFLFPLMSTAGIRVAYPLSRHFSVNAGMQYTYGVAKSFGIGLSEDFDGAQQQSFVTYRQPISLLQFLVGVRYRVLTNTRSRGTLIPGDVSE